ncbi:uncharacterized protein LY79DRAFT_580427 [Colletotrichum navitas]|uniref:Uncharacterized protein n=1 Tax=Colletotrichum navitas TaxID=681940 RepID=A0AAD8PY75_9PEZI|nr:uncharacterized protein LY79DRAFT_580427 [Colletotrichum navitas]KAK1589807.1 hypothetical protein LY79DRAFT_580427 [Colletotrichum navitas]
MACLRLRGFLTLANLILITAVTGGYATVRALTVRDIAAAERGLACWQKPSSDTAQPDYWRFVSLASGYGRVLSPPEHAQGPGVSKTLLTFVLGSRLRKPPAADPTKVATSGHNILNLERDFL